MENIIDLSNNKINEVYSLASTDSTGETLLPLITPSTITDSTTQDWITFIDSSGIQNTIIFKKDSTITWSYVTDTATSNIHLNSSGPVTLIASDGTTSTSTFSQLVLGTGSINNVGKNGIVGSVEIFDSNSNVLFNPNNIVDFLLDHIPTATELSIATITINNCVYQVFNTCTVNGQYLQWTFTTDNNGFNILSNYDVEVSMTSTSDVTTPSPVTMYDVIFNQPDGVGWCDYNSGKPDNIVIPTKYIICCENTESQPYFGGDGTGQLYVKDIINGQIITTKYDDLMNLKQFNSINDAINWIEGSGVTFIGSGLQVFID